MYSVFNAMEGLVCLHKVYQIEVSLRRVLLVLLDRECYSCYWIVSATSAIGS